MDLFSGQHFSFCLSRMRQKRCAKNVTIEPKGGGNHDETIHIGKLFPSVELYFPVRIEAQQFRSVLLSQDERQPGEGLLPDQGDDLQGHRVEHTTVDNALKELKKRGLVLVEHRYQGGHQTSNLYKLRDIQQQWLDQFFIPEAIEEELEREKESENFVREVVEDDLFE